MQNSNALRTIIGTLTRPVRLPFNGLKDELILVQQEAARLHEELARQRRANEVLDTHYRKVEKKNDKLTKQTRKLIQERDALQREGRALQHRLGTCSDRIAELERLETEVLDDNHRLLEDRNLLRQRGAWLRYLNCELVVKNQIRGPGIPDQAATTPADGADKMDLAGRFLASCCEDGPEDRVTGKALYAAHVRWSECVGERPLTAYALGVALRQRGYPVHRSGSIRYRKGIRLKVAGSG